MHSIGYEDTRRLTDLASVGQWLMEDPSPTKAKENVNRLKEWRAAQTFDEGEAVGKTEESSHRDRLTGRLCTGPLGWVVQQLQIYYYPFTRPQRTGCARDRLTGCLWTGLLCWVVNICLGDKLNFSTMRIGC